MKITDQEKAKLELYIRQKNMLDRFLEKGAISVQQHDKSLGDLTEKMWPDGVPEQEKK